MGKPATPKPAPATDTVQDHQKRRAAVAMSPANQQLLRLMELMTEARNIADA